MRTSSIGAKRGTSLEQVVITHAFAAFGCNFAEGLIDANISLMACLTERAQERRTVLAVNEAATARHDHDVGPRAAQSLRANRALTDGAHRT
jgi:ribosomal protein S12 methylthiotransferase accessory factor YcaO